MTNEPKITALVGCQIDGCAESVSYGLDMVKKYQGQPVCEYCYDDPECFDDIERDEDGKPVIAWDDLPDVLLSDLTT